MDLFQSCGHCWIFQIFWHVEYNTFTASSFRIWNSLTGIPSPPLDLFIVMLPKPTWLHIPGCLTLGWWSYHRDYLGHEDLFCIVFQYPCHLFLISSASVRSIPFLSFIVRIFAWNVPLVSLIFLKRSLVFRIPNPERWCCESAALNMPANLEHSAVATGLEKVSFHSNTKERQCQRMLKLPHNCTHLTR